MATLRFRSEIKIHNGNPHLLVSVARAAALKKHWRRPMPVLVRINGKPKVPWRINMMPIGDGRFYLYLHGDVRKASGTRVGDRVSAEISFDADYRGGPMHPMPVWFRAALRKNPEAKKGWEALIPSRKKEILRYFSWLKSPQARDRNVQKALHVLSGGQGRFMARSWNE
jgi:hypothetical protein